MGIGKFQPPTIPRHSSLALSMMVWSMPCQTCRKRWITSKTNKNIFEIFLPSGSDTILVFPSQRGCRYSDGNSPNGGVECKGYDKMTTFSQIFRCISETVILRWAHAARQLFCKHRILFPSIQHLA